MERLVRGGDARAKRVSSFQLVRRLYHVGVMPKTVGDTTEVWREEQEFVLAAGTLSHHTAT